MIRSAGRPSWPNATTTVPEAICWSGLASARSSVSASTHSFTATAHYTSAVAVLTSCSSLRSAEGAAAFGCRLPGDVAVRKQRRSQQRAGTESSTYHLARTRTRARHPSTSSPALSFMDPVTRSLNADASSPSPCFLAMAISCFCFFQSRHYPSVAIPQLSPPTSPRRLHFLRTRLTRACFVLFDFAMSSPSGVVRVQSRGAVSTRASSLQGRL